MKAFINLMFALLLFVPTAEAANHHTSCQQLLSSQAVANFKLDKKRFLIKRAKWIDPVYLQVWQDEKQSRAQKKRMLISFDTTNRALYEFQIELDLAEFILQPHFESMLKVAKTEGLSGYEPNVEADTYAHLRIKKILWQYHRSQEKIPLTRSELIKIEILYRYLRDGMRIGQTFADYTAAERRR